MLRIRLRRSGKKGQNFYRVVVADQRSPRDGAFLEILGSYNPHANPPTTTINKDVSRIGSTKVHNLRRPLQKF